MSISKPLKSKLSCHSITMRPFKFCHSRVDTMAHWELDDAANAAFIDGLRRRNSSCKLKGSDRWSNSTSKVDISFALVGIEMIAGRRSIQALNATFVGGHVSFQRVPNDGRIMLKPTLVAPMNLMSSVVVARVPFFSDCKCDNRRLINDDENKIQKRLHRLFSSRKIF